MTKAVAKTEQVPEYLKDAMSGDDNRGCENVTKDDLIIPRLGLTQALSPEIVKDDPAYVEGADQGMLFNTVRRTLYDGSVTVIPVLFEKQYLVWRDRKLGGGFGGQYATSAEANAAILERGEPGYEVVDTPIWLCLLVENDKLSEIAIPLPKSKAKVSRQWNSLMRILGGPSFSRLYTVEPVGDSSDRGKFWNFKVTFAGFPTEEQFKAAEKLYDDLSSGEVTYKMDEDKDLGAENKEKTPF